MTQSEADALASMMAGVERRIDQHDQHVETLVASHVDMAVTQIKASLLTEEERIWVKLALQAQAQRVKLRQAIIEKTLTMLLLSLLVWFGSVLLEYIKNHGWKP
jgi:hypothetical protein